jgi:hypothetical protein
VPPAEAEDLFGDVIFEQDPIQILNAILPLYINGQVRPWEGRAGRSPFDSIR